MKKQKNNCIPLKLHEQFFIDFSMQTLILQKWVEPPAFLLYAWLAMCALHSLMEIYEMVWPVLNLIVLSPLVNELLCQTEVLRTFSSLAHLQVRSHKQS